MIGRLEHEVQGHAETFEGHIAKHKEGTLVEEGKGDWSTPTTLKHIWEASFHLLRTVRAERKALLDEQKELLKEQEREDSMARSALYTMAFANMKRVGAPEAVAQDIEGGRKS